MTTISATIIKDSISEEDKRITTMQLRYPRFIHSEFMTHRMFSRNASSSRAIPVERMIQDILNDTAMPIHWGKNQKGMQAHEECNNSVTLTAPLVYSDGGGGQLQVSQIADIPLGINREMTIEHYHATAQEAWLEARDRAIDMALAYHKAGYHKQVVNRLLEPFMHINTLVTATEWSNFFALRNHPDAEPHIAMLAREMKKAMDNSRPWWLWEGDWHLPYMSNNAIQELGRMDAIKSSVARCARVSYFTHDTGTTPTLSQDLALYDQLVGGDIIHASPAEHQATPTFAEYRSGNFRGWKQYRKSLINENIQ